MLEHPQASELALRLAAALIAGGVLGFDRGERGRAAGMRTMMLVCLAAATAMVLANLLMDSATPNDAVRMDPLRLPLGILSGIGFIGAGAIVRRGDLVQGVSTAAALWLATVAGLCMGGGEIALGSAAAVIGLIVLSLFVHVEKLIKREQHAQLMIVVSNAAPEDEEIHALVQKAGYKLVSCSACYSEERRELECDVMWRSTEPASVPPPFVRALAQRPGVLEVSWRARPQTTH